MAAKKAPQSLAKHAVKDHGYPYGDADKLPAQVLKDWHRNRHLADADAENEEKEG